MEEGPTSIESRMLWGEHQLREGKAVHFRIGPLRLWCEKAADELWVAYEHSDLEEKIAKANLPPPKDIAWSRWVFKGTGTRIRFVPVFPNKSVVVKPESAFKIVQGAKAKIYVRIPIWIAIQQSEKREVRFIEIPSVILSKTWFGTFTEGELCYWISTAARRVTESDPGRPYLAICPIQIQNNSEDELNVEKLALRVDGLSIFEKDTQLWSDEMKVNYQGEDSGSRITYTGKPPAEAQAGVLLSPPRQPEKRGFAAKTFSALKDLPGLDLLIK